MSEVELACRIIELAVQEANQGKQRAKDFLNPKDPDFRYWCLLAGLNPEAVAEHYHRKGEHHHVFRPWGKDHRGNPRKRCSGCGKIKSLSQLVAEEA